MLRINEKKNSRRRRKLREDRKRQISDDKKIQKKDVEELKDCRRDSKGREKISQNSRIKK